MTDQERGRRKFPTIMRPKDSEDPVSHENGENRRAGKYWLARLLGKF
jgi:hypothetical protein